MEERIWHKNWPTGLPKSLDYPETPVHTILKSAAVKYPDLEAFVFEGHTWTYPRIRDSARRFANALHGLGLEKGDVIAFFLPNLPQFVIGYYGTLMAGAVFSPCSIQLGDRELTHQLNDCGAKAVLAYAPFYPNIERVRAETGLEHVIVTAPEESRPPCKPAEPPPGCLSMGAMIASAPADEPRVEIDPRVDLAHIAYTGGTTGRSKGVLLTHYNILAGVIHVVHWGYSGRPSLEDGILYIRDRYEPPPGEEPEYREEGAGVLINVAPWFHAMGVMSGLNASVYTGTKVVIHAAPNPQKLVEDMVKYKATLLTGAPTLFHQLIQVPGLEDHDLSGIRVIRSGAAPLPVELRRRLQDIFPRAAISEGYGMTEAAIIIASGPSNRSGLTKPGTVGPPTFDTEIRIVDPETAEELPLDRPGEICARGPQVMRGYLNRPLETAETLRDGWLHTGDIGYFDEDGYLVIADRKKDMLIYKGYNVYPRELEEILLEHPRVRQCAVVGLPHPEAGEIPKAFVVPAPGATVTESELMDYVNGKVASYKKVRALSFIDALPVSGTGKVLKRVIKENETAGRTAAAS
ncbi:MAG: AMP-binding protein [Proteobacteria bacterium]|nr:AMP-binding protein [Pseudomonadota bacterium]